MCYSVRSLAEVGRRFNPKQKDTMSWSSNENKEHKNRDHWEFPFTVSEVVVGVRKRIEHHKSRLAWWESELEQAEAGLKDKGFQYRERRNSMNRELVVVGDADLANRAKQCNDSVGRHRLKIEEFETWKRVLSAQQRHDDSAQLPLKYGDIEYFGL